MEIILASASPRRKELLEQIGIRFKVKVSDTEEKTDTQIPHLLVQELSRQKAEAVLDKVLMEISVQNQSDGDAGERDSEDAGILVIGADTVVSCDGLILGKPRSREEAVKMLSLLQGRTHEVYTGVTLLHHKGNAAGDKLEKICRKTFYEATKVHFYPMREEEIAAYVDTGEPMDKAGAYGIQGLCARYISGIEGDYNNVVGLPIGRLYQEILYYGIDSLL